MPITGLCYGSLAGVEGSDTTNFVVLDDGTFVTLDDGTQVVDTP